MTVDSEAIFASPRTRGTTPRALEELRGSLAAAWLDEREPGHLYARPRRRPPALDRRRPARALLRLDRARARGRRAVRRRPPAQARDRRGHVRSRSRARAPSASSASRPTRVRARRAPGRARAARGRVLPRRLARSPQPLASLTEPSRRDPRDALLAEPLADEELERRPRAAARVEHAVDLPLGQQRRVVLAAPRPSRRTSAAGRAAAPAPRPARPRARAAPPPPARRSRPRVSAFGQRAERVPVERLRRHPAPVRVDVLRGRRRGRASSPSSWSSPSSSSRVAKRRGTSPAARFALFQCRSARSPSADAPSSPGRSPNSFIVGERPSRSAHARSSLEDLLVRVAPADPGLEGGELAGIDARDRAVGAFPRHGGANSIERFEPFANTCVN